jgi:hypothetical protein
MFYGSLSNELFIKIIPVNHKKSFSNIKQPQFLSAEGISALGQLAAMI